MALEDVQPFSAYTYESVLPRLGYQYRVDDVSGRGAYYNVDPEEGTGRVRFEEGAPTDPNLQYAPAALYEQDLRQQGFVPTSPGDLYYYAQYGQYGEGKGFGGDVRAYLDYVYGPGTTIVQDPTHGYLIKPADPARALEGGGTPIALPNRSGSFGDFLKEGALTIAPLAAMAFAGPLAATLAGGTATAGSTLAANALLNTGIGALSGADVGDVLRNTAISAGLSGLAQSAPVTEAVSQVKDTLVASGIDPSLATKIAPTLVSTAGNVALTGVTGADVLPTLIKGGMNLAGNVASGLGGPFTYRAEDTGAEPASMDVSVTPAEEPSWTSGYDVPIMDQPVYSPLSTVSADAEAQPGGFYGFKYDTKAPDYGDFIPGGLESTADVAAAYPDLYPGGVLPSEGMMTTFKDGVASYIPQTPVDVARTGVKFSPSGAAGAAQTAGTMSPGQDLVRSALDQLTAQGKYDDPSKRPYLPSSLSTGSPLQSLPMFTGLDPKLSRVVGARMAAGGEVDGPVDFVPGPEDRFYARHAKRGFAVRGPGTGQSDDIPTMLADGEYVIDSEIVSALGDGSNKAGAEVLDKFREEIRKHKRSAPTDKIPPKAKSPLEYLKAAKGKKNG